MKELLAQQLDEVLARAGLACEGQLRVGAATVSGADRAEVTAATVLGAIGPAQRDDLQALVDAIADEFGLQACVRFSCASFAVRFSRLERGEKVTGC